MCNALVELVYGQANKEKKAALEGILQRVVEEAQTDLNAAIEAIDRLRADRRLVGGSNPGIATRS